ncbi:unnamed protein product [Closterium sp. NIES-64]|nr:unnamed protein product [Closterium sp. NIES-64]
MAEMEAFDEGGPLHDKRVYLFGCTEPQLVHWKGKDKVVHVPAVVAVLPPFALLGKLGIRVLSPFAPSDKLGIKSVLSPFAPSDKLGIKSVQMETEMIVPMREMKMDWIPFIPDTTGRGSDLRRHRSNIFTLKCIQRRAGLRQMKQERVKKFEYCLPYNFLPAHAGGASRMWVAMVAPEEQQGDTVVPLCPVPQTHPSLHILLSTYPPTPPQHSCSHTRRQTSSYRTCRRSRSGHTVSPRALTFPIPSPLPPSYIFLPHMQEEQEVDTVVSIMYPFEGDNPPPPVTTSLLFRLPLGHTLLHSLSRTLLPTPWQLLAEYDWEMDEYEEFTDNLVKDESLPEAEKAKFIEYVKKEVKEAKLKAKKKREERKKAIEDMGEERLEALKNLKFLKFYPKQSEDTPDISEFKVPHMTVHVACLHHVVFVC